MGLFGFNSVIPKVYSAMSKAVFATFVLSACACSSNSQTQTNKNQTDDSSPGDVTSFKIVKTEPTKDTSSSDEYLDGAETHTLQALGLWSWHPDATRGRETPESCRLSVLKSELGQHKNDVKGFSQALQGLFHRCEAAWARGAKIGLLTDLNLTRIKYDIDKNPKIQTLEIEFENGEILKGLLAIQDAKKSRPLVIARCGIFCDVIDRLPRIMMMHLFDESPFNVLVLASTTGEQFVRQNARFGIGGYYEASQHLKIIKYLRTSHLNTLISDIHVVGISMGGNAALMTSLLADKNRDADGHSPVKSVFALCPVVNLQETLDHVLRDTIRGYLMGRGAWTVLRSLYLARGDNFLDKRPPVREFYNIVGIEAQRQYSSVFSNPIFQFSPFLGASFQTTDDVWNVNRFINFANETRVPTFVLASDDDPLVSTQLNARTLQQTTRNHSDVQVQIVPGGRHCAQNLVYGWGTATHIFQQYLLNFSENYKDNFTEQKINFNHSQFPVRLGRLERDEYHFAQRWELEPNKDHFKLTFDIWSPDVKFSCEKIGPYGSFSGCFRHSQLKVPLSELNMGFSAVSTEAEAQALTRWANSNIQVYSESGKELHHTSERPGYFSFSNTK